MPTNDNDAFARVIRKLDRLADLDQSDYEAIRSLAFRIEPVPANHLLVGEGNETKDCCILLEGYACRHKRTSGGSRQIVSFHMPGDILDLQHLLLSRADHNIQTVTQASVAWVPAVDIKVLASTHPAVGEAMWRDTLIDASIFREWVLNVGRRNAKARITHMLCEFVARREAADLGMPERFELPFSNEQIGDATGLAAVHVSRILHELGQDGVIERDQREVEIRDWARMREIADFDPAYLHAAA
jgi:CRP-like cAMP-binding protein